MDDLWQLDANLTPLGLRREYVLIGGDLVVGSLLSQIVYWHRPLRGKSKLRVKRDGHHWVAKTREDWMNECCLTRKEYLRAMAVLQRQGLIELRVMKFDGVSMNHVRLHTTVLRDRLMGLSEDTFSCTERVQPVVPFGDDQSAERGHQLTVPKGDTLSTEITTETTQRLRTARATPDAIGAPGEVEIVKTARKKNSWEKNGMKASEVLQNLSDRSSKKPTGASSSTRLAEAWRRGVKNLYPEVFQGTLTMKQLGMLKKFGAHSPEHSLPCLSFILESWVPFGQEVKIMAGVETVAMRPSIEFLLKHREIAYSMFLQSIAPTTLPTIPRSSVGSSAPAKKPTIAETTEQPYKASEDEIAALLEGLK